MKILNLFKSKEQVQSDKLLKEAQDVLKEQSKLKELEEYKKYLVNLYQGYFDKLVLTRAFTGKLTSGQFKKFSIIDNKLYAIFHWYDKSTESWMYHGQYLTPNDEIVQNNFHNILTTGVADWISVKTTLPMFNVQVLNLLEDD